MSTTLFIWSWWPDAEQWADQYSDFACSKVAPTKVATGEFAGQDRKYAAYYTVDPERPEFAHFAQLVKYGISQCGISLEGEFTFPHHESGIDTSGNPTYAFANVAKLKLMEVNTVLWLGGTETDTSRAAEVLAYRPEWIVAGEGGMDSNGVGRMQGQTSWSSSWTNAVRPRYGFPEQEPSYWAYKEAEPEGANWKIARDVYRDWFMLFYAIQLSGSTLNPTNVELGLRAVAPSQSTTPFQPAIYFEDGNFTFVKDGAEMWWDPSGHADFGIGCWRMVSGGLRKVSGSWNEALDSGLGNRTGDGSPDGQERITGRDPCTLYQGSEGSSQTSL